MEDPELKPQLICSKHSRDVSVVGVSEGESGKRRGQEGSVVCVCVCVLRRGLVRLCQELGLYSV